jgi:uncharacterized membrane protein (DUF2068 family)
MPSVCESLTQEYGILMAPYAFLSYFLLCVAFFGYWRMRKWGVYLYIFLFIITFLCHEVYDIPDILHTNTPGSSSPITLFIGFANLKKMT